MRRRQRHGDGGVAVVVHLDAIDQAEVVDIDRDFRIENLAQGGDHVGLKVATLTADGRSGLGGEEAFEIVAVARGFGRSVGIDRVLDTGAGRLGHVRVIG